MQPCLDGSGWLGAHIKTFGRRPILGAIDAKPGLPKHSFQNPPESAVLIAHVHLEIRSGPAIASRAANTVNPSLDPRRILRGWKRENDITHDEPATRLELSEDAVEGDGLPKVRQMVKCKLGHDK